MLEPDRNIIYFIWQITNVFSSCLFERWEGGGGRDEEIRSEVKAKNRPGTLSLSHFSLGQVQTWLCIRRAHTHTHILRPHIQTFTYTHKTNRHTYNSAFSRHRQIIHLCRKGWLRLWKYSWTGPAHAPFNTFEWVIGCINGRCSHLFNRLWTMFHRGGCPTLHTGPTPIKLHYNHILFLDGVFRIMTVV